MTTTPEIHCAHDAIVKIGKLKEHPKNPNTHPTRQIELLGKIIREQGWRAPITVSTRSGFIVRGHGRLQAAQWLGLKTVPVDRQDYESDEAELADLVADNKIAELAIIDDDMLADLIGGLAQTEIDLELTGFDLAELISGKVSTSGENDPENEWKGMPEFNQRDARPHRSLIVHFEDDESIADFKQKLNQDFSSAAKYIFHPKQEYADMKGVRYADRKSDSGEDNES